MTIYEKLGRESIEKVITDFYVEAFRDPIIGHFFVKHNREELTAKQIEFISAVLGGPKASSTKSLRDIHIPLNIRGAHYGRRQVLMRDILEKYGFDKEIVNQWLALEKKIISRMKN